MIEKPEDYKPKSSEEILNQLIKSFYSEDGIQREKARYELVSIGKPAVEYLIGLQYSPREWVRWEAIKTLSQIADPEAIPILINALENHDFDVRWLAAEGLIEIGKDSIRPLLESLISGSNSKYMLEGAHHVLKGLEFKKVFKDYDGLIKKLEKYNLYPKVALAAQELLSKY